MCIALKCTITNCISIHLQCCIFQSLKSEKGESPDHCIHDSPLSMRVHHGQKWKQESLLCVNISRHPLPTFTSSPIGQGHCTEQSGDEIPVSQYREMPWADVHGVSAAESAVSGGKPGPQGRRKKPDAGKASGLSQRDDLSEGPADRGRGMAGGDVYCLLLLCLNCLYIIWGGGGGGLFGWFFSRGGGRSRGVVIAVVFGSVH